MPGDNGAKYPLRARSQILTLHAAAILGEKKKMAIALSLFHFIVLLKCVLKINNYYLFLIHTAILAGY